MPLSRPPWWEALLLAAAVAAPAVPIPALGALLLLLVTAVWVRQRPPRREVVVLAPALLTATVLLGLGAWVSRSPSIPVAPPDDAAAPAAAWAEAAAQSYESLWREIEGRADRAAEVLSDLPLVREVSDWSTYTDERRMAFHRLEELAGKAEAAPGEGRRALLLVDPDGEAQAWAGDGLLHEPLPEELPRKGLSLHVGLSSATLLAVEPLGDQRRPWRVVAGSSLPTDVLPFPAPWGEEAGTYRWTLRPAGAPEDGNEAYVEVPGTPTDAPTDGSGAGDVEVPGTPTGGEGRLEVRVPGRPVLVVSPRPAPALAATAGREGISPWDRGAWGALAVGLLMITVMRCVGLALAGGWDRGIAVTIVGLLGALAGSLAAAVPPGVVAVLLGGLLLAACALAGPRRFLAGMGRGRGTAAEPEGGPGAGNLSRRGAAAAFFAGAAAAGLGVIACRGVQLVLGTRDLGSTLFGDPEAVALRLGLTAAVFAFFLLVSRLGRPVSESAGTFPVRAAPPPAAREPQGGIGGGAANGAGSIAGWAAFVLAAVAALLVDFLPFCLAALLAAGGLTGIWRVRRPEGSRVTTLAVLAAVAAVFCGVSWETTHRAHLREELAAVYLPGVAPPPPAELNAVKAKIDAFFSRLDIADLALRPPEGMDRWDVAYSLWRRSPLVRFNALSAVVVEPDDSFSTLSFSFGLPLREDVEVDPVDRDSVAWQELRLPFWDDLRLEGETILLDRGRRWGKARWWFLPRPGFRLGDPPEVERVLLELLQGAPGDPRAPHGLPPEALYALYPPAGRALVSPWAERPPVPPALEEAIIAGSAGPSPAGPSPTVRARVSTPGGSAWGLARRGRDGYEVLYLPALPPLAALERVGTFAAGILLVLAALTLAAFLPALPRPAFRAVLSRTVRSYSRRLLLLYTLLLLLPLLLLNLVILRAVEAGLAREQRGRGEQALAAVQQAVLGSILSPEPGFGVDTALSPEYLKGLARLVNHDVNAYFGSRLLSSSTGELFSAGLLPRRIPGEIYERLALVGFGIDSRVNREMGTPYLELYAPVSLPEEEAPRIFLSLPLLAQQEEAAQAIALLRRRAVVASTALFALLVAVGGRLARNFTRPLAQLVEGTRRIAGGASTLGMPPPAEQELAALVSAVDDMARRIAQGRAALLREKALVERMVEHITSGVVSVGADLRVLMHNRVAEELLGVSVGRPLLESVGGAGGAFPGATAGESDPALAPVADFLAQAVADPVRPLQRSVHLTPGGESEREWTLIWVPLPGPGEPTALLVVEDVTEIFRGQRLAAWAEMARIIAHEIKNPLTPVRLSAEHMRQVWDRDREHFGEIFERCTTNILTQVDELQQIASEFSTYSRIPKIELEPGDLEPEMASLVDAYEASAISGVEVVFANPAGRVPARFDRRILARAVRNLLENAVRANGGKGRVTLRLSVEAEQASITVADEGPGVPPEQLGRIFDPYFSTHDTGTGLGLPIARRIAEEHGGEIIARNRPDRGLEVEIRMPLLPE